MTENATHCALITGASQGLGRAFAEECAGRGMDLVLVALAGTGLPEVARILGLAHKVRIEALELDLTDPGAACEIARILDERGLAVDVLINNAGVGFTSRFEDASPWQNETTVQLNVANLVRLTQSLLPRMRERGKGWILNVASMGAYYAMPSMPVYSSTKSFVLTFSLLLHEELRGTGVSLSVLCPNGIRTNRACRQLIERQGWAGKVTCQYPDEVARTGLDGLFRGRAVIVPGPVNRVLRGISGWVPRGLYMRMIPRRWGTEK
ncbi:MAG TPA: SDR family NAD(P)-dependent oxidoreductase, partial [Spirochaetia bacterium]